MQNFQLDSRNPITIKEIIKLLEEKDGVLPDLTGINIMVIGLGDVAYPQELPTDSKVFLKDLWTELFKVRGAKSVNILELPTGNIPNLSPQDGDDENVDRYPYVSPVRFKPLDIFVPMPKSKGESQLIDSDSGNRTIDIEGEPDVQLPTDEIGFIPNTEIFIDENRANDVLSDYANTLETFLTLYPEEKIYIVGSVALTKNSPIGGDVELSLKRANKVKDTLINNFDFFRGKEDSIDTMGIGSVVPWISGEDLNADGTQVESTARQKRSVWIMLRTSDKFKQLQ